MRQLFRSFVSIVWFSLSVGSLPPSATAHPLGNFTVNHFARLRVDAEVVHVDYVVDMAEIPAFQELRKADENGDGKTSQQELDRYLDKIAPQCVDALSLVVDGQRQPLGVVHRRIATLAGAGGLSTLRMELELTPRPLNAGRSSIRRLQLNDSNDEGRIGWREMVAVPGNNVTIFNSSVFANSASNELRFYPLDMLAAPLEERSASLSWTNGAPPAGAALLKTRSGRVVSSKARDRFAELISIPKLTLPTALLGLLIAAVLGTAHALSPGHGKTVVGAYLVGSRGTPKHALFLGLTVTVTHTAGVFALGFLTLFASHYILPEKLLPALSFASGLLIAVLGLTLLFRRLALAVGGHDKHVHAHSHSGTEDSPEHAHVHVHFPGGKPHSHLPLSIDSDAVTWKSLLALGISGGLLPCPSALVVLLSAIALHRIAYGLLLVLAFSVGLAATLTTIGLLFVYAGRWLSRFRVLSQPSLLRRFMPVVSSLVVSCLGLAIAYAAATQAGYFRAALLAKLPAFWQNTFLSETPLARMGAFSILGFGLILGFKHATEADHVIAVSTIVSDYHQIAKVAIVGALWGAGHTITLVLVGFCVLLLRVAIPESVATFLEFGVALMIIGLSGAALRRALRNRHDVHVHRHSHGDLQHVHLHFHEGEDYAHDHGEHAHPVTRIGLRPLLVGAMHGLAGSAALTLLVLTQVPSVALGIAYLFLFGAGSILGMMLVSVLIGLPFSLSAHRLAGATFRLQALAGVTGVLFGFWYAYHVGSSFF